MRFSKIRWDAVAALVFLAISVTNLYLGVLRDDVLSGDGDLYFYQVWTLNQIRQDEGFVHMIRSFFNIGENWSPAHVFIGQYMLDFSTLTDVDTVLLVQTSIYYLASLLLLYKGLERMFKSKANAFASTLATAASPHYLALTGHYLNEPLMIVHVCTLIYVLSMWWDKNPIFKSLATLTLISLAQVMKFTQNIYVMPVACILLWRAYRQRRYARREYEKGGKIIAAAAFAFVILTTVSGAYVYSTLGENLGHYRNSLSPQYTRTRSLSQNILEQVLFIKNKFFKDAGLLFFIGLMVAAAVVAINMGRQPYDVFALTCAGQIVFSTVVVGSHGVLDPRFILPVLPFISVTVGWGLKRIGGKHATAFVCLVFLAQTAQFQYESPVSRSYFGNDICYQGRDVVDSLCGGGEVVFETFEKRTVDQIVSNCAYRHYGKGCMSKRHVAEVNELTGSKEDATTEALLVLDPERDAGYIKSFCSRGKCLRVKHNLGGKFFGHDSAVVYRLVDAP